MCVMCKTAVKPGVALEVYTVLRTCNNNNFPSSTTHPRAGAAATRESLRRCQAGVTAPPPLQALRARQQPSFTGRQFGNGGPKKGSGRSPHEK